MKKYLWSLLAIIIVAGASCQKEEIKLLNQESTNEFCKNPFFHPTDNSSVIYYSHQIFRRTIGAPFLVFRKIENPYFDYFDGNFVLKIQNGRDKHDRVSSAEIWIDGVLVAGPSDFSKNESLITKQLKSLTSESVLVVKLFSAPGGFIDLWIEGTLKPGYGLIGSSGGIVKTDDGASVEIPAGALSTTQLISIANITKGFPFVNDGWRIYEFKPDGLTFSKDVIITLLFDNTYIDLNSQEENYGVAFLGYQDFRWGKLNAEINLKNKTAQISTTHFSIYGIEVPSIYSDYFNKNKHLSNSSGKPYYVPYYSQVGLMCAYYSLSMVTKYAGYPYKAPFFLQLMDDGEASDKGLFGITGTGISMLDAKKLVEKLSSKGISSEIFISGSFYNLAGYILLNVQKGSAVLVGSSNLSHAFVVTGNDPDGFFISDPSGVFLDKATGVSVPNNKLLNHDVTYQQFYDALKTIYPDWTLVIKSLGNASQSGLTLNLKYTAGTSSINIIGETGELKGKLSINGKFKPNGDALQNGYALVDPITKEERSFDGTDRIVIEPNISNSYDINHLVTLHLKIENKDVASRPFNISPNYSDFPLIGTDQISTYLTIPLRNLQNGKHNVDAELRSLDQILYDSWRFEINIVNEFFDNNFNENFETYTTGSFPNTWIPDGNGTDVSKNYVDNSTFYEGNKSLKLFGILGDCWAAIAYHSFTIKPPFELELSVKNGNETLSGCNQSRAVIGLNKETNWISPSQRYFIKFEGNGKVYGGGGKELSTYNNNAWYLVRVRYEKISPSQVKLSYWLNNQYYGTGLSKISKIE